LVELELVLHTIAAIVSVSVAVILYPLVKKSLDLKSGLVYEMGWMLLLPAVFIAVFSSAYFLIEGLSLGEEAIEVLELLGEIFVILASTSILALALKIRSYMKKLEG
jgi:hypothetical protein